jgi:hypothetical protein
LPIVVGAIAENLTSGGLGEVALPGLAHAPGQGVPRDHGDDTARH